MYIFDFDYLKEIFFCGDRLLKELMKYRLDEDIYIYTISRSILCSEVDLQADGRRLEFLLPAMLQYILLLVSCLLVLVYYVTIEKK